MYDSNGHGNHFGCHVVHNGGVTSEIAIATIAAQKTCRVRHCFALFAKGCVLVTAQHINPMSIIETPMVFRMSTRNKSLFGAHPHAITYSCTRNSTPNPKTSNPRQIVLRAILWAVHPFC